MKQPDAATPPPADATILVRTDVWCDLYVDGRKVGRNQSQRVSVRPGLRAIKCSQEPNGKGVWSQQIDLAPGEHRDLRGTLYPRVSVTVQLSRGDAVRLSPGGQVIRNGGLVKLGAGRYRVEVLEGGRQVAEKFLTLSPHAPICTLRDRPDIGCFQ
jgi:hypothetical protein